MFFFVTDICQEGLLHTSVLCGNVYLLQRCNFGSIACTAFVLMGLSELLLLNTTNQSINQSIKNGDSMAKL